jgi:hypothetical protein
MNENVGRHTHLFKHGEFVSHAGLDLSWKIEMDALSDPEWFCIKKMMMEYIGPFKEAVGIPRGGILLANLLNEHATQSTGHPILFVDDVLTTGTSMVEFVDSYFRNRQPEPYMGWVVFSRTQPPNWVKALFQMPKIWVDDPEKPEYYK